MWRVRTAACLRLTRGGRAARRQEQPSAASTLLAASGEGRRREGSGWPAAASSRRRLAGRGAARAPLPLRCRRPRRRRPHADPHLPAPCARSHHGADCTHLHRLPTAEDEARHALDYSRDIFGRERAPASRDGRKKGGCASALAGARCRGRWLRLRAAPAAGRRHEGLWCWLAPVSVSFQMRCLTCPLHCAGLRWPPLSFFCTGVGSYERECKTLYVNYGGAGTLPPDQVSSRRSPARPAVLLPCCLLLAAPGRRPTAAAPAALRRARPPLIPVHAPLLRLHRSLCFLPCLRRSCARSWARTSASGARWSTCTWCPSRRSLSSGEHGGPPDPLPACWPACLLWGQRRAGCA